MKIKVTKHHIYKGSLGNCYECPIALALKHAGFTNVWVVDLDLQVYYNGRNRILPTPQSCYDFIHNFDKGQDVEPFEFELDLPQ